MRNINIKMEELDFTKPIPYYAKFYGLSENAIRNRFKKIGIYNNFLFTNGNSSKIKSKFLQEEYNKNPKICPQCNKIILYNKRKNDYCSLKCSATYTQKDGGNCHWSDKDKARISKWAKINGYRQKKQGLDIECPVCKTLYYKFKKSKQICCSKKCYLIWMKNIGYMKGRTGGYREKAGRGKMGWYKGYYCNSTWELAWVIYSLEHGVQFERNKYGFEYCFDGRKYKFYPDFRLNTGEFIEIKGWITEKDKAKFSYFPEKINILYKKDLVPIFDYVKGKYGCSYTDLYD